MLEQCWRKSRRAVDYAAGKNFEILAYLSGNGRAQKEGARNGDGCGVQA
jgi:hypothetical protein